MNEKVFEKFPELETERLILTQVKMEDADIIFKGNSTESLLKYIPRELFTTMEEAEKKVEYYLNGFEEKSVLMFKFCLKETGKPVGYGGLFNITQPANKGELGYIIFEEHWGKGYATEGSEKLVEFGMNELQLNKIFALIDPQNIGSQKVVEKLGFEKEGLLKQNDFAKGKYFDIIYYALFNKA